MVTRAMLDRVIGGLKLAILMYGPQSPDDVRHAANALLAGLERWRTKANA